MSLQGKSALVTGSAGGLGRIIAETLLASGANVTISDINANLLATTKSELEASHPNQVLAVEVNVTDEDSVKNLIAKSVEKFGALDILVNNAGVIDNFEPAHECDKQTWDKVIAVNLTGPFLVTKHAVPHMLSQAQARGEGKTGGNIVNIASVAATKGIVAGAAYVASKHGVVGLTKNTAGSYGRKGVYCITLLLGAMPETNMVQSSMSKWNAEAVERSNKTYPEVVTISTADVARYIAFLSEDGVSKTANGSSITLSANWPDS